MINITSPNWGKIHTISASKLNSFFSCGFRFQIEYLWEMKSKAGIGAARGKGLHKAIEEDNKHYMAHRTRIDNLDLLLNIANSSFDETIRDGVFIPRSQEKDIEKIIDKARTEMEQAVKLYFGMEKTWEPVAVEESITEDVGYPLKVIGILDMVDENNCIWDWKTSGRKAMVMEGIQNWIYSKLYEKKWGVVPTFKYVTFVTLKTKPYVDIQELPAVKEYSVLDRYIEEYIKAIEANVFLPYGKYNFLCSEAACPFYLHCDFNTARP